MRRRVSALPAADRASGAAELWLRQAFGSITEKVHEVERLGKLQRFVVPQLAEILMSVHSALARYPQWTASAQHAEGHAVGVPAGRIRSESGD
ncbi:MAG: hypothetical protein ACKVT1_02550 [Dehalococcoidia bacterium]